MSPPSVFPTVPLIGRVDEKARLLELVGAPGGGLASPRTAPSPPAVVVVGGAGVGKSCLVQACLPELRTRGFHPLAVTGSSALHEVPFAAFRELLPPFDDELGSWLRVLREGTQRLVDQAGDREPLLVVDDLHELDTGSAALIRHALDAGAVHLVATLRDDAEHRPHVLDLLKRFWGDRLAERLDLAPFTPAGVAELAAHLRGAPLDRVSVERLWSWTGGNALLVSHALADGSTVESYDERAGLWQLDRGPVGPEVIAAVERALAHTSAPIRQVATLLAESDVLSLEVLAEAVGADAVDAAEAAGIVVSAGGPRGVTFRLRHPVYGDVLIAQGTSDERRRMRHDLATAMITTAGSVEQVPAADRVLLALWYVDQQDLGRDAQRVLLDAAQQSLRSWNHRAAIRFAEPVWAAHFSTAAGNILCRAYDALGLDEEACAVASRLLADADQDLLRMIATIQLAGAENRRTAEIERARAILDETIAGLADAAEPMYADGLRIYLATMLMHDARLDEALAIVEPIAAESIERGGGPGETVAVVGPIGAVQGRIGVTLPAVEELVAAMADGRRLMAARPWLVSVIQGLLLLEDGRLADAEAVLQPVYDQGVRSGDIEIVAWAALQRARVAAVGGTDLAAAARWFREAAAAFGELVRPGYVAWALGGLAGVLGVSGDAEGAQAAAAAFDGSPRHPVRLYEADAARARSWADVASGEHERARDRIHAAAATARASAQWAVEAACLHDLARLTAAGPLRSDDAVRALLPRVQALLSDRRIDSPLIRTRLHHIQALAGTADGGAAGAFTHVAQAFSRMGARRFSAEAWAGAARAHERAGEQRRSTGCARLARATMGAAFAGDAPLLADLPEVRLTARQRTIAELAAAGHPRQEIADRCFLSLRTVDRHLLDTFAALGLHGRDELAAALVDLDVIAERVAPAATAGSRPNPTTASG